MNKINFISDFFVDELIGGAEKCNDVLINLLSSNFSVNKIKSIKINPEFIKQNKDDIFIISNFFTLSEESKKALKECYYIIYEHDHKYVSNNNPAVYQDYIIPAEKLSNLDFYSNAAAVLCQSTLQSDILYKNTLLRNIVNLRGNLWSEEDLKLIEENIGTEKTISNGIMKSLNKNKGTNQAISYCHNNNINFELIEPQEYPNFLKNLAKVDKLIFFPQWVESYNRVMVEARILNCKVITNSLIGVTKEEYFKLKERELLDFIRENNKVVLDNITKVIKKEFNNFYQSFKIPKLTFITSLYKGEKFIRGFLENITNLDLFETSELLIYDSDSPENEYEICKPFLEKYKNIKYKKLEKNYCPTEVLNFGIKDRSGQFLTTAPVDDIRDKNYLRWTIKSLLHAKDNVCLVYGNCLKTNNYNETMENNTASSLYDHSIPEFSRENMIKSLPGPMPVWKKSVHEKIGLFDEKYRYPADWELWLRMVDSGFTFEKINKIVGLYYFNENGLTTSKNTEIEKIQQESEVFFKYKHIFGKNYEKFYPYFSNYRRK